MSLTSYRAAPPRAEGYVRFELERERLRYCGRRRRRPIGRVTCEGFLCRDVPVALAVKPGGDLLFRRLSDSTIGAVWFHGRVRDGIGWVTNAMTTKL